jgi:hypothetical protein
MEEHFILTDRALTLRRYKYEALCLNLRPGELRELRKVVEIWKHEIENRESRTLKAKTQQSKTQKSETQNPEFKSQNDP